MTAPSYTEDLNDLNLAESETDWDEFDSPYDGQGANTGADPDYPFIQGNFAVAQICTKTAIGSQGYNNGAGTGGHGTDGAYFVWQMYGVNSNLNTYAVGGFQIVVGSSLTDFKAWYVGGVDKSPYPYGGWVCNAVNTTVTHNASAGTPTATEQYIGSAVNVTAGSSKGYPHAVDAIRYGRGSAIFQFGETADYATIAGFAAVNDTNANRWGLIQETAGGYLWKGRMQLGSVTNLVDFRDSDKTVFVQWTPKVTLNFNTIEILNDSSNIEMTGFTFQVLDTTTASRGRWITTDNATVLLTSCTFLDMYDFIFKSNSTLEGCTWKRHEHIVQNGADFNACLFSEPTSGTGLYVDDIALITNSIFVSDGTGHAMELSTDHAGNTYELDGNTFSEYASANGTTGNEAIFNNSGGHVIINLVNTTSIPSYRNGSGATTAINLTVTLTLTGIVSGSEVRIQTARGSAPSGAELYHVETTTGADVVWPYNYSDFGAGYKIDIIVHHVEYTHLRIDGIDLPDTNGSIPIQQETDRWYSNPIITKTETFGKRPIDTWQTWVDSYMDSDNPTLKYNTEESLLTYLSVDIPIFSPKIGDSIIPSFSTVNSAKIWLYIYANDQTGTEGAAAKLLRRNWVTNEVTWNEWSNGNAWTTGGGTDTTDDIYGSSGDITLVGAGQTGWVSWTVTDDIQDWLDGIYPNLYGWLIIGGGIGGTGWEARSSNYLADTSLRPYLSINWTQ